MGGLKWLDWRMSELFCFIFLEVPLSPSFPFNLKDTSLHQTSLRRSQLYGTAASAPPFNWEG